MAPTGPRGGEPYNHGWAAVFPVGGSPRVERFGPFPAAPAGGWFAGGDQALIGPGRLCGSAGDLDWDLAFDDPNPPLHPFGRTVWEKHLLPGAQCVPFPSSTFTGNISGNQVAARGAVARIYGHSNAQRWCWLHADLGDGGLLEVVSATARRPALRNLAPLAMLRLRLPGSRDLPRVPLLAAPRMKTRLTAHGFTVRGPVDGRALSIEVELPPERCVELAYTDPDGSTATCTNSEIADATVTLREPGDRSGSERRWRLEATAHAEIGRR